jgi:hypothetical protein
VRTTFSNGHTLLGEPIGECVPDSDEEPEGFLETSLVFWDMYCAESLPRVDTMFQRSASVTRNALTQQKGGINVTVLQTARAWGNKL